MQKRIFVFGPPTKELRNAAQSIAAKYDANVVECSEIVVDQILKEEIFKIFENGRNYIIYGFFTDRSELIKVVNAIHATHIVNFVQEEKFVLENDENEINAQEKVKKYHEMIDQEPSIFEIFDSMKLPSIIIDFDNDSLDFACNFINQEEYTFYGDEEESESSKKEKQEKDIYDEMRKEIEMLMK